MLYSKLFHGIKRILPKISETEIIALKSGGTSIDRDIFQGRINYKELYKPIQKERELMKISINLFITHYILMELIQFIHPII